MKHINKKSLRRLPLLYLIYALFNNIVWIVLFIVLSHVQSGGVKVMSFFLTLVGCIALQIMLILCIYGLIDLSDCFRKSCYVYLLSMIFLMANMILVFIVNMSASDNGQDMVPVLSEAREILLDLRVPMDAIAAYFLLNGFSSFLKKAKDQKICRKCNALKRIIFFLTIVYCVFVLLTEIIRIFIVEEETSGLFMAFSLLSVVVTVILALSIIPIFIILLKAAKQTYELLTSREEAF